MQQFAWPFIVMSYIAKVFQLDSFSLQKSSFTENREVLVNTLDRSHSKSKFSFFRTMMVLSLAIFELQLGIEVLTCLYIYSYAEAKMDIYESHSFTTIPIIL